MSLNIYWTKEALETFDIILEYISSEWGDKEAAKFFNNTQNTINTISKQPYIFKQS
jgi:plasmid stabilization system protein ParE